MKIILFSMAVTLALSFSQAQDFAPIDKSVMDAAYYPANAPKRVFAKSESAKKSMEPKIKVIYSRPLKKGREVFGELLKYGEVWRLGANETTQMELMTDAEIGGKKLKAGTYGMVAIPSADSWVIKFNKDIDGWGNYSYDAAMDVASVTVSTQESKEEIEAFSIALYEKSTNVVHMKIGWDKTFVEVPITL